ncbi:MAG: hypothetical protein JW866_00105 [Ignavibacteriales bacterium]|nr:hypothetical protein [Ignavibacteriales bacterium]
MNTNELYDHITKNMTPEQALMKLLEGTIRNYEHLKFNEGEEIHPTMIVVMATKEMGWNIAIPNGDDDEELSGMIIGTNEYIDSIINDNHCNCDTLGLDYDENCTCNTDCECGENCECHD